MAVFDTVVWLDPVEPLLDGGDQSSISVTSTYLDGYRILTPPVIISTMGGTVSALSERLMFLFEIG